MAGQFVAGMEGGLETTHDFKLFFLFQEIVKNLEILKKV